MGFEQDTLIYVEQEDKSQASAAARGFAQKSIQNRAYINTLGARLAMKYLASEDIKSLICLQKLFTKIIFMEIAILKFLKKLMFLMSCFLIFI